MPIIFSRELNRYHIQGKTFSMVISFFDMQDGSTVPLMRYYGPRLEQVPSDEKELQTERFQSFDTANAVLPFAVPTAGHGDFRPLQLEVINAKKQNCTRLSLKDHWIQKGKEPLAGLPCVYVEDAEEAETLILDLEDSVSQVQVRVAYTLLEAFDALTLSTQIRNAGEQPLHLEQALSATLSLEGTYDLVHLHGAWAREYQIERVPPMYGERTIRSSRGASGHQHNPFAILADADTTEDAGNAYGVSLVYSGNFQITIDQDAYDHTRLVAGINPQTFRWKLDPGELFQTPEAVLAFSDQGLSGVSQIYHELYRKRLCRGKNRDADRPIFVNNWEATYFDFTEEKLLKLAGTAAELGAELFVLDDGWFGERNDDTSSLGDWFVNQKKLPLGLRHLVEQVHGLGLKFGLWFEPEMISEKSRLYREHPEWVLHAEGYGITPSRNQYILDLSRTDVQDYLIDRISTILRENAIDYVKWDMNRNFAEIGSENDVSCQELPHRYMLGLYRILGAITQSFPEVLFEGCAGGGGRFDPGILAYVSCMWASDNSDAVSRLRIQYGASLAYPPSVMGAYVSAVPNHQVRRVTNFALRGNVAACAVFGYALDFNSCTEEELAAIRDQIRLVKEIRKTIRTGRFTRLISPYETADCAWQFVTEDEILVLVCRILQQPNCMPPRVKLKELPADARWEAEDGACYDSAYLMNHGLTTALSSPMEAPGGDFQSELHRFRRVR